MSANTGSPESSNSEAGSVDEEAINQFIERWTTSGGSERANFQPFLTELCSLLDLPQPDPATDHTAKNDYVFERAVDFIEGATGFADLYKRDCFVMEAKQGTDTPELTEAEVIHGHRAKRKMGTARRGTRGWQQAMEKARNQARRYARALPESHGWPPFLAIVDVGYCIDVYADFSRQGKVYSQYPDPHSFRIMLEDLRKPHARERLRRLWLDPMSLDPTRHAARVTRELAEKLARVAKTLEADGHPPAHVANFLMRCLFTMFAEDTGLLPDDAFKKLLRRFGTVEKIDMLPRALEALFGAMDEGGFAWGIEATITQFNGNLFHDTNALPLTTAQAELLLTAAQADWTDVEPAIFGTLLERALDPRERHKLGAHYTPREYVERLVMPTVIEPLREEWTAVQATAIAHEAGDDEEAAQKVIRNFHRKLCQVRVLDPACGTGNFLYVTLDHLKRLEGEVLKQLETFSERQGVLDMTGGYTISPEQLLGIEINPRAAAIAEVVLWIGYLQWHFRTFGHAERLDPPILKAYDNIQHRDALITWEERHPKMDENGEPLTVWDRRTMKKHPTTGELVPDETARLQVYEYEGVDRADWPEVDFIVGNPPFIGAKDMIEELGEGYTEAVRSAYTRRVTKSADFVMYWWYKAAERVRKGNAERFGFIATNSLRQTFNRKVVDKAMNASPPVSLVFAIPDHPWVDAAGSADVRISMTAAAAGSQEGRLQWVVHEEPSARLGRDVELEEKRGNILPDLTIGADVAGAASLDANADLSNRGVCLFGSGFIVSRRKAAELGIDEDSRLRKYIRHYRNGRDILHNSRDVMVIDLYGLSSKEVRDEFPKVYQHVLEHVKPERDENKRKSRRENWWIFGEPNPKLRDMLEDLSRYIATVETAKHRIFVFLDEEILPDNKLVAIASDDAYHLGVLSSRIHATWSLTAGSTLEDRPVYVKTTCFEPFPFPVPSDEVKQQIRGIAESIDAHRKKQQELHPGLTLTGMYNVLEKLREGQVLTENEQEIHEQALTSVLLELHNDLDEAVAEAYGWPVDMSEDEILERLVALNAERKAEEEQGIIRYLRPEYQAPDAVQKAFDADAISPVKGKGKKAEKQPWPRDTTERIQAVQRALADERSPATVEDVAQRFKRARRKDVRALLETLDALGVARRTEEGEFTV